VRCTGCEQDATHKVGEELALDDPNPYRHNLTAYVCCRCFGRLMRVNCAGGPSGWKVTT
jgi:hypothetical protein